MCLIRKISWAVCLLSGFSLRAQVQELEEFRKAIHLFVQYDQGKLDSIAHTAANSLRLKEHYQTAFLALIQSEKSHNLDDLKANSIKAGSSYNIGNNGYFFSSLRRNPYLKSRENNEDFLISLYGIYDYKLPDFVSIFIQPFQIDNAQFVVYFCKLNGHGTYFVKEVKSNQIVFQNPLSTTKLPILQLAKLDANHFLLIEDAGDAGQRALVVRSSTTGWEAIAGFKGKSVEQKDADYRLSATSSARNYLQLASSRAINSIYGSSFIKQFGITYQQATQTISYKQYAKTPADYRLVFAKWNGENFLIDDYYIGQEMGELRAVPFSN